MRARNTHAALKESGERLVQLPKINNKHGETQPAVFACSPYPTTCKSPKPHHNLCCQRIRAGQVLLLFVGKYYCAQPSKMTLYDKQQQHEEQMPI